MWRARARALFCPSNASFLTHAKPTSKHINAADAPRARSLARRRRGGGRGPRRQRLVAVFAGGDKRSAPPPARAASSSPQSLKRSHPRLAGLQIGSDATITSWRCHVLRPSARRSLGEEVQRCAPIRARGWPARARTRRRACSLRVIPASPSAAVTGMSAPAREAGGLPLLSPRPRPRTTHAQRRARPSRMPTRAVGPDAPSRQPPLVLARRSGAPVGASCPCLYPPFFLPPPCDWSRPAAPRTPSPPFPPPQKQTQLVPPLAPSLPFPVRSRVCVCVCVCARACARLSLILSARGFLSRRERDGAQARAPRGDAAAATSPAARKEASNSAV